MIRIALCDDSADALESLKTYVDRYKVTTSEMVAYDCFTSGVELLSRITGGVFYDLVFLDVVMPLIDGIETAREIYEQNKVTQIVFLTASPEFAVDSYSVSALDYILKPIKSESFTRAIKKFEVRYNQQKSEDLIIQEKSRIIRIPLSALHYVEVLDHHLIYYLTNSYTVRCRQSLSEIEGTLLKKLGFVKTSRSYIVNMDFISKIEQGFVTTVDGSKVPISRANFKAVSDRFLKYKFEQGVK